MSASLIGLPGSSAFRLFTAAVSMSLTGSCFSAESAPKPVVRHREMACSTSDLGHSLPMRLVPRLARCPEYPESRHEAPAQHARAPRTGLFISQQCQRRKYPFAQSEQSNTGMSMRLCLELSFNEVPAH